MSNSRRLKGIPSAPFRDLTGGAANTVVGSSSSSAEILRITANGSTCAGVCIVGAALVELQTRVGVNVSQLDDVDERGRLLPLNLDLRGGIACDVTIDDHRTANAADCDEATRTDDDAPAIHVVNGTGIG